MTSRRSVLLLVVGLALCGGCLAIREELKDTVQISIEDYKLLFEKAYLTDVKARGEQERRELRADFARKEMELKAEKDAIGSGAKARRDRERVLGGNWRLLNHSAQGLHEVTAAAEEPGMVAYEFTLEFRIFDHEWTSIPIIDTQAIVEDWHVLRLDKVVQPSSENSTAGSGQPAPGIWRPVELGDDTFLTTQPRRVESENEFQYDDHTFVTQKAGRYQVRFRAYLQVRRTRQLNSLQLNLVYPLSYTRVRLQHSGVAAQVRELTVEPSSFFQVAHMANHSDIHVRLPSARVFEVKWRLQAGSPTAKVPARTQSALLDAAAEENVTADEENQQSQATVVHDALHAVADGTLQSTHRFKYVLDSEQALSSVDILFPGNLRISSVVAHGMMSWQASAVSNLTGAAPNNTKQASGQGVRLNVKFKSSTISKEVILMVSTEMEYSAASGTIDIQGAVCEGVLRQAGTVGVVKTANVEVYERSSQGMVRTSAEGIPQHMRDRTDRPVVLGYKFLSNRNTVGLSVLNHEEIGTMEAIGDSALQKILVADEQTMHNYLVVVQNTNRQYLHVWGVPPEATLWSLRVNSVEAKPVRGRDGALMVPLLVGSGASIHSETSVEFTWLTSHAPLAPNGTIEMGLIHVDVPVSKFLVELQFPEHYQANFTGSLSQVATHSQRAPTPKNYETGTEVVEQAFDFASMPKAVGSGAAKHGIKVRIPRQGKKYNFEKLFVVNRSASLSVTYGEPLVEVNTSTSTWNLNGLFR
eukprot:TRINITY_DN10283_c0_g1_i1.p1 TRINITY_DN10283_c0_g1~~TRINITY_DN10283_c0_g1_i1.p1  ORF type:complete len:755 (-),score=97.77 TRINITY_DN10283_c0_g1_i1:502-2766(-)